MKMYSVLIPMRYTNGDITYTYSQEAFFNTVETAQEFLKEMKIYSNVLEVELPHLDLLPSVNEVHGTMDVLEVNENEI